MNKNYALTIDKCEKILQDALTYAENQYAGDDIDKGYLNGAMHEATAALPLVMLLQNIKADLSSADSVIAKNVIINIEAVLKNYENGE